MPWLQGTRVTWSSNRYILYFMFITSNEIQKGSYDMVFISVIGEQSALHFIAALPNTVSVSVMTTLYI
jgi:hypothetical protein